MDLLSYMGTCDLVKDMVDAGLDITAYDNSSDPMDYTTLLDVIRNLGIKLRRMGYGISDVKKYAVSLDTKDGLKKGMIYGVKGEGEFAGVVEYFFPRFMFNSIDFYGLPPEMLKEEYAEPTEPSNNFGGLGLIDNLVKTINGGNVDTRTPRLDGGMGEHIKLLYTANYKRGDGTGNVYDDITIHEDSIFGRELSNDDMIALTQPNKMVSDMDNYVVVPIKKYYEAWHNLTEGGMSPKDTDEKYADDMIQESEYIKVVKDGDGDILTMRYDVETQSLVLGKFIDTSDLRPLVIMNPSIPDTATRITDVILDIVELDTHGDECILLGESFYTSKNEILFSEASLVKTVGTVAKNLVGIPMKVAGIVTGTTKKFKNMIARYQNAKDEEMRDEIINNEFMPFFSNLMKNLCTLVILVGVFGLKKLNPIIYIIAWIASSYFNKMSTDAKKKAAAQFLMDELELIDEKINDAKGDGPEAREAKYALMRTKKVLMGRIQKIINKK